MKIKKIISHRAVVWPLLSLTTICCFGQNLVDNGGFEIPEVSGTHLFINNSQSYPTPPNFEWTVVSSVDVQTVPPQGGYQSAVGDQFLDLHGNTIGKVFQNIVTQPGRRYAISFAYAGIPGAPTDKTFKVLWGGTEVASLQFDTTGKTASNMGWKYYQIEVTASSTSTELRFESTSAFSNNGPTLDDVSVVPSWSQLVSGGWDHSLAVALDGDLWSWGGNDYGQLGRAGGGNLSPGQVMSGSSFIAVAGGGWHSLAVKSGGTVWAWGYNYYGQLGEDSTANNAIPQQVKGLGGSGYLTGVISVSAGSYNSYALKSDGTVWAWGQGLGVGNGSSDQDTPVQVLDTSDPSGYLTAVVAIAGGDAHCLALKSNGKVRAWGYNLNGQLGNNTTNNSTFATKVYTPGTPPLSELSDVVAIAAGFNHSVALKSDKTVWTWGDDDWGQVGNGSTTGDQWLPGSIGLSDVISIGAGADYCLARKSDGTAWAWGRNHAYQLGLGDTTARNAPVQISTSNLSDVGAIVASKASHSFVIGYNRTLRGWGANYYGQVGDGTTTTPRTSPVALSSGFGL